MSDTSLSSKAKKLKRGKYRHYKGLNCEVSTVAIHSESLEELVIYKHDGNFWARPLKMFLEEVLVKGTKTPRFKFIGKTK